MNGMALNKEMIRKDLRNRLAYGMMRREPQ
jgi:hypothetical protein